MATLSKQGIIEYLNRSADPLKIYTIENDEEFTISENQIDSNSFDLTTGSLIGEFDRLKFLELKVKELISDGTFSSEVEAYDYAQDLLILKGINTQNDSKLLKKSLRLLNLNNLDDYQLVEDPECLGVYTAYDDEYTFSVKVVIDENKVGFVIEPDSHTYYQQISKLYQAQKLTVKSIGKFIRNFKGEPSNALNYLNQLEFETNAIDAYLSQPFANTPSTSFVLVWANQYLKMPNDLVGRLDTKSSDARMGLSAHPSSGRVDAGFEGQLVLELKTIHDNTFHRYVGDKLCGMKLETIDKPVGVGYNENHQSQYKDNVSI
ncbi:MAG: hypothetical protein GOU98_04595 [Candidatus Altiarchaeota archaeon]|nr:hypothetical protein [Candidatus Altiarchaeota archaeon]